MSAHDSKSPELLAQDLLHQNQHPRRHHNSSHNNSNNNYRAGSGASVLPSGGPPSRQDSSHLPPPRRQSTASFSSRASPYLAALRSIHQQHPIKSRPSTAQISSGRDEVLDIDDLDGDYDINGQSDRNDDDQDDDDDDDGRNHNNFSQHRDNTSLESASSQVSAMHLSESYSRPVFVLGARPSLLTSFVEPLPVGYLTREERRELEGQEQALLERNELLPNRAAMLDTLLEVREPDEYNALEEAAITIAPSETTSLLDHLPSRTNTPGVNYADNEATAEGLASLVATQPETSREERRKRWETAVHQQLIETTVKYECRQLVSNSMPLVATFALQYSMQFASIFSLGHLGRTELAAASLASMTASISMIAFSQGIATSLDTLCAQSFGANQPHLVGLHLQRCMLLLLLCLVPVAALWLNAERIFVSLKQSPEVAHLAGVYLRILLLGAPGYVGFEALKRFTAALGNFRVSTYALFVSAPLNAILNYVLVWHPEYGFGFAGAPVAMSIAYWTMFLQMIVYVLYGKSRHAWHGFTRQALSNWGPMLRLAGPGCLMTASEWLAYEMLAIISSILGVVPLGAQAVLSTTGSLVYQVPFAMSVGVSARVGNLLGAGLAGPARTATDAAVLLSFLTGLAAALAILLLRHDWAKLFSSDPAVIALSAQILPLNALFNLVDCVQCVTAGVLRGQGRQHFGGVLNLAAYYGVAIPIGLLLCFPLGMGLAGLWIGMILAATIIAVVQTLAVTSLCNWDGLVLSIQNRMAHAGNEAAHRHMK
ncbi:ethionine resistance protein [Savitreella phatthalungensis]